MRNKILKAVTWLSVICFIISGLALDSVSYTPYVVLSVSLAWLVLFSVANKEVVKSYE